MYCHGFRIQCECFAVVIVPFESGCDGDSVSFYACVLKLACRAASCYGFAWGGSVSGVGNCLMCRWVAVDAPHT